MLGRIILGLLVALLLVPAAQAASFDCSKARTPFAKAVCSHPDLSKADDAVAAAFKAALDGLSAPASTEVSSAQDAWVRFANIACTDNAKPATKPYNADSISCLTSLFTDRTEQLKNSKTVGGLRFYYIDRYAALRDPDPVNDSASVATKSVSTPRIDDTGAEATAFNRFIAADTKDVDPSIAANPKPDDGVEDDAQSIVVSTVDAARISMTVNSYSFGHGAAHGNYAITYLHFLRAEQRGLEASDIFGDPNWKKALERIALAAVTKTEGDDLMLDDTSSINDLVTDPTRWDFSADGLILQFEPYEIAAYAVGAPTVTIPWSDLDGLLAPGAADFQK